MIIMVTLFSILLAVSNLKAMDPYGLLGGFAGGVSSAMLILPRIDRRKSMITRSLGAIGLLALYLSTFLTFYLSKYA